MAAQRSSSCRLIRASRLAAGSAKGFTLMEVIIVLAVLSMFVAMAVPLAGRLEARGRVRETERLLELTRAALLGPRSASDGAGRRLLAGYAGDLGGLPPLRRAVWDDDLQRWQWPVWDEILQWWGLPIPPHPGTPEEKLAAARVYWASGMGQPRNLWLPLPPGEDPPARWRGPYLHEPRDEFPGNAEHLRWTPEPPPGTTLTELQRAANREIEMRQTAGRLADAWGRSLLFFYVTPGPAGAEIFQGAPSAEATVYIVSEGPDLRSSHPAYRRDTPANEDNLVLVITPQEQRDEARREETKQRLQAVREALVGRLGPVDRLGRPVFGGFVGDQGLWPGLFVWQGAPAPGRWEAATVVDGAVDGQPRGLWTRDTHGDGPAADLPLPPDPATALSVLLGFGWRGPYLPRPDGTGEAELLRDAWGVPLRFRLSHAAVADPPPEQTLTVSSAGPDGIMETADDLREVVPRHFDVRRPDLLENIFILEGTVVNETEQNRWFRVRLHASPASQPAVPEPPAEPREVFGLGQAGGNNTWSFSLPVRRGSAGPRLLELAEYHDADPNPAIFNWQFYRRRDWTVVFIGSGGTAAPERVPLTLRAR